MITQNLQELKSRIAEAAQRGGRRPEDVRLLAVTKTVPMGRIREAISSGQRLFGENYVQEAAKKLESMGDLYRETDWHFIGHLQSNKAKLAVQLFNCIETVDNLKLARALDRHARAAGKRLSVYIQVNVARDPKKSGLSPEELPVFLAEAAELSGIDICGLMTLPPWEPEPESLRPWFGALRDLRDKTNVGLGHSPGLRELSMGMSQDFEVAIEEGATVVRIGTALFGRRECSIGKRDV
ncbi:MAG: YggS family pyridoxal phosphate-dependent enzyme [Deltaproteobacteria bacterium]|nr:YggS family pyridoxal phosphate-dependent enzyme [Deltaproteobacteria bacterium]MBW1932518.1 YggS family pyridoxal phosphate-dependent enzyme [Deltaproteobacteria bacterium]MBW1937880.1 YggS family pyridoxal phosphate-dependent enzyme [Deltaproteobacteria bacterium]MBW2350311.1 YggS family pyridoxal phosphate-dependent enzyme [Deltaproteobacteria bacterium]